MTTATYMLIFHLAGRSKLQILELPSFETYDCNWLENMDPKRMEFARNHPQLLGLPTVTRFLHGIIHCLIQLGA